MSNPFGEYEDEEYDNVNQSDENNKKKNQNKTKNDDINYHPQTTTDCDQQLWQSTKTNKTSTRIPETNISKNQSISDEYTDTSSNPFGESNDLQQQTSIVPRATTTTNNKIMNLEDSFDTRLDLSSSTTLHNRNISNYRYGGGGGGSSSNDDEDSKSISRQSIASVNSSEMANNLIVGNFSIGDGGLQKEGLLCPDCLIEFKTITELMNHFEQKHRNSRTNDQSSLALLQSSTSGSGSGGGNMANDSGGGQMSHQIKGFLNKLINNNNNNSSSSKSSGKGGGGLDGSFESRAEFGEELGITEGAINDQLLNSRIANNPIASWKLYMKQGPNRSHMEFFRTIRESRIERYIFETNKLLIRLDKLLRDYPPLADLAARREHEQSVVNWLDDSVVNLCPSCASKFNILTRKKHHCRLCGAVMCTKCSEFIDFEFARKLIAPIGIDSVGGGSNHFQSSPHSIKQHRSGSIISTTGTNLSSLAKSGTNFLSMVTSPITSDLSSENIDKLRVCLDCKSLLTVRKEKIEVAHSKPMIVQLYEQLRDNVNEINRLMPLFARMADSLNCGETTYNLRDANDLKHKLTKLGESCDLISRKIESQGVSKVSPDAVPTMSISQRQLNLQLAIRRSSVSFLRQYLLGLPELPDEQKLELVRRRHAELIQKRIAYEKDLALREQHTFKQIRDSTGSSAASPYRSINATVSIDDGFCPQISGTDLWKNMNDGERSDILEQDDPMLQQMNIIRSYIRQARQDHRYEEVNMLEDNLHELEIEYYFKQQQQQPTPSGGDGGGGGTDQFDLDPDPDPVNSTMNP